MAQMILGYRVAMRLALHLVPAGFALVLVAAHFLRAGLIPVTGLALGLLALLAVRRPWAGRALQGALVLAGLEWVRTLVVLAQQRQATGAPWVRMALILGAVAGLTFLAAWLLGRARPRRHFGAVATP